MSRGFGEGDVVLAQDVDDAAELLFVVLDDGKVATGVFEDVGDAGVAGGGALLVVQPDGAEPSSCSDFSDIIARRFWGETSKSSAAQSRSTMPSPSR